ncbi:MAG: hypothetical protein J0I47_08730 [Sphingomonas sp.]|nr:hypothetical protein [Sphingomonas sp.]
MNDVAGTVNEAAAVPAGHWAVAADQRARPLWLRWAGPILSIAIIGAVINAFGARDLVELWRSLPRSPLFWATLALLWAATPVADFLIFRGLWGLPLAGLAALFRKAATNELVFGYTGELQFYVWARRHADIPGSPFGAVRDVAVLSALVGNVVTIVLLAMALPVLGQARINPLGPDLVWSAIALIGSSMAVMLFRHRLFALSRWQFWRIAAIHLARAVIVTILFAILWYLVQPSIALGWWVVLAAARQFVTRLPFLPNKDLVFAGLTAQLLSGDPNLTDTVVLVATLFAAGQVLIGGALAVVDLVREAALRRKAG